MKNSWKDLEKDDEIYFLYLNGSTVEPVIGKTFVKELFKDAMTTDDDIFVSGNFSSNHNPIVYSRVLENSVIPFIYIVGFNKDDIINTCITVLGETRTSIQNKYFSSSNYKMGINITESLKKLELIKIPKDDISIKKISDLKDGDTIYGINLINKDRLRIYSTKIINSNSLKEISPHTFKISLGRPNDEFIYFYSLTRAVEFTKNKLNNLFLEKVQPIVDKLDQLDSEFNLVIKALQNPGKVVE